MKKRLLELQQHPLWDQALLEQLETAFAGLAGCATNPDNMSLAEWKAALATALTMPDQLYAATSDELTRRQAAAQAFEIILIMLGDLPGKGAAGQMPVLSGLSDFLDDLDRGRRHPWRETGAKPKHPPLSNVEERMWVRIITAVELLKEGGCNQADAIRTVSSYFPRRRGIDAVRLPAQSTIKDHHNRYQMGEFTGEAGVRKFLEDFWKGKGHRIATCAHGDPLYRCAASGGERCDELSGLAKKWAKHLVRRV